MHPQERANSYVIDPALCRAQILTARNDNTPHHWPGHPISRTTYIKGCRCPGCTRKNREGSRAYRTRKGITPTARSLPPLIAQVRNHERKLRENLARSRALATLAERHPDEYRWLVGEARLCINLDRGPLPGDQACG